MASFRHFILTRFNPRIGNSERGIQWDWLGPRLQVFEQICAPSVARQACRDFEWLVFFDERTPKPAKERIEDLRNRFFFEPIWISTEFSFDLAATAIQARPSPADRVLTTRLDNDDAIHPQFVNWTQHRLGSHGAAWLSFPLGCQLFKGELFLRPYLGNPFLSRIEPLSGMTTAYHADHWLPQDHKPRQVWTRQPAWLQTVHGQNLANTLRGVWVRPDKVARIFEIPSSLLSVPTQSSLGRARKRFKSLSSLAPTADLSRRLAAAKASIRR